MDVGSIVDEPLNCLDSPVDPVSRNKAVENQEALGDSHAIESDEGSIEPELSPSPCMLVCEQSSDSSYCPSCDDNGDSDFEEHRGLVGDECQHGIGTNVRSRDGGNSNGDGRGNCRGKKL